MKNKGFAFVPFIIIALAFCAGFAALMITKKNDSPVEQVAEAVLRTQGVDVDLSPDDDCSIDDVCDYEDKPEDKVKK